MAVGSGWSSSPWGGSEFEAEAIPGQLFDVDLSTDDVVLADASSVDPPTPEFLAGAESPIKVGVVFTLHMSAAALSPANYMLTEVEGGLPIPIATVTATGSTTVFKVEIGLAAPLISKGFYILKLNPLIVSDEGQPPLKDFYIFQWADMTTALVGRPLEIPIRDFSGEVTGGILGNPDGLVFFSPAYEPVLDESVIEVAEVSVCTKAFDEYHIPDIPDPTPFTTFGGARPALLGDSNFVLWARADRLGQVDWTLHDRHAENLTLPNDGNSAVGTLVEPIDITKAGFLNDSRWRTFPGGGQTVFRTAANLSAIGPGPTTQITLEPA